MVFDNGLKVLLVSDKTSDKAAAAMGKSKVIFKDKVCNEKKFTDSG